jgi:hypothetical protein
MISSEDRNFVNAYVGNRNARDIKNYIIIKKMKMKKKTDMKMIRVERSVFKTKKVMC